MLESFSLKERQEWSDPPPTDVVEQFPSPEELKDISLAEERALFEQLLTERLAQMDTDEDQVAFTHGLAERVKPLFEPRNAEAWQQFSAALSTINGSADTAATEIADVALTLRQSTFDSYAHYEHAIRQHTLETGKTAALTPELGITYHVEDTVAHLHYGASYSIRNKRKQMEAGLAKLAELLEHEPELQQINAVHARSWIVAKHPKMFERYGFTIPKESDDQTKPDLAIMDKETFLEHFRTGHSPETGQAPEREAAIQQIMAALQSDEFFDVAGEESIGGNAGQGRKAINAFANCETGEIVQFGNPQDIDQEVRDSQHYGIVTFVEKLRLTQTDEPSHIEEVIAREEVFSPTAIANLTEAVTRLKRAELKD